MPYDPKERFVQPAEGIIVISSPALTAAQVVELEKKRREKLVAGRRRPRLVVPRKDQPVAEGSLTKADLVELEQMASLLARRNAIDEEIAVLIDRPALRGSVGEWIAHKIFRVTLEENARQKGFDGRFADGPLAGKTVNVKWYGKREGLLDINPDGVPDYYLVMTGPKAAAMTSRGQTRPWVITEVFLFDAPALVERLPRLGVAAGVRKHEWEAAKVYPAGAPRARLTLSDAQREALKLFAETGG